MSIFAFVVASLVCILGRTHAIAVHSFRERRNNISSEAPSVDVVLCHSNSTDPEVVFQASMLRSKGYVVHLPDCSYAFRDTFVSERTGRNYKLWGRRLKSYKAAVANIPAAHLVLLLDVKDVLVMGDAMEAARRFTSFGVPLVASCTEGMWPPPEDCPAYNNVQSQFAVTSSCQFPCAGAFMGTAEALRQLLDDPSVQDQTNDQCWLHERLSKWPAKEDANWTLDLNADLFLDVNRVPKGMLLPEAGRYKVQGVDLMPTIVHMPGLHPQSSNIQELYALVGMTASADV